jgi:hypothetical protein
MLPFHVSADSKKIHIKDMTIATKTSASPDNWFNIIVSEPYFKTYRDYPYSDSLIFKTPTEMIKSFLTNDKFSISIEIKENELKYLSQFESVNFIYPRGFINSDTDDVFYSTINVPELVRMKKASDKEIENRLENKVMDFFGIDR